jgi:hypothetical protein
MRVLVVALVLSLGANAYLLLAAPRSEQPAAVEQPSPPPPEPKQHEPPKPDAALPVPSEIAQADRAKLEQRLAETEAKIEKLLPLHEKFERAERTPENEDRVRPYIDKVFHVKPGEEAPYELECHEMICHLVAPGVEWEQPLQTDPEVIGAFNGKQFGPDGVYMEIGDPEHSGGLRYVVKLAYALNSSTRARLCMMENPQRGEMKLRLSLDPTSRRVSVDATGSVAGQAVGVCIRRVLEDLVAATPVPSDVTSFPDLPIPIEVP